MKFAVLALLGLVVVSAENPSLAEVEQDLDLDDGLLAEDDDGNEEQEQGAFNLAEQDLTKKAKKHHHHHHNKKIALSAVSKEAKKATGNPDNSRKVFEESVKNAANTVATQQAFEAKKTADVATRNAKDTAEANAVLAHVRFAANENLMGRTYTNTAKQQWTGPELVQLRDDTNPPAPAAPAAPAAAPATPAVEAPEQAKAEEKEAPTSVKKDIQYTYDAKKRSVKEMSDVVKDQLANNDDWTKSHKARSDKINAETEAAKNAVKKERSGALIGDVNMPKDPEPWYKNKFMTPS